MAAEDRWDDYFYSEAQLACGAVSIKFDGVAELIGSAVYLAPGLFVTAKHVIEEPLKRVGLTQKIYENKKFGQLDANLDTKDFIIEVIQLPKLEARIAQRWNIRWMRFSHDLDLAVLIANESDGPITHLIQKLPVISLNIHPIQKSMKVTSCGFFQKTAAHTDVATGTKTHSLTFQGRPGRIVALHLDVASVAGPTTYEIDNKIEHMMSGGPVIGHDGSVMAINSSGFESEERDALNRTIATPFLRAMFMEFKYIVDGNIIKTSLHDLARRGILHIIGYEHLRQSDDHIIWSPNDQCTYCQEIRLS